MKFFITVGIFLTLASHSFAQDAYERLYNIQYIEKCYSENHLDGFKGERSVGFIIKKNPNLGFYFGEMYSRGAGGGRSVDIHVQVERGDNGFPKYYVGPGSVKYITFTISEEIIDGKLTRVARADGKFDLRGRLFICSPVPITP